MVCKSRNIIKIFIIFFFLNITNSYANIVYDKENIIITEIDIYYYKKIHYEKFKEDVNNSKALKNLVIVKKLIKSLEKNNPVFLNRIDKEIFEDNGNKNINSSTILDIVRYFKTRNEFVYNYFKNDFNKSDLENVFNTFVNLNLPISDNNCLTIIRIVDLKDNTEFINIFYENFKNQMDVYEISIDNVKYDVCVNINNKQIIEKEIFKYIELKTEDEFKKFVYAQ